MAKLIFQPHCCVPKPMRGWPTATQSPPLPQYVFAWLNGMPIRYVFVQDRNFDRRQAAVVEWAFRTWEATGIGVKFVPADGYATQLRIRFNFPNPPPGDAAFVGRTATRLGAEAVIAPIWEPTMEFAWDLRSEWGEATALHEVGHALGLCHEHQRHPGKPQIDEACAQRRFMDHDPRRGAERADLEREIKENVSEPYPSNLQGWMLEQYVNDWDFRSIMHYPMPAQTIRKQPAYFTTGTPRNLRLSRLDKERIVQIYPTKQLEPKELTAGTPQDVMVDHTGQDDFVVELDTAKTIKLELVPGSSPPVEGVLMAIFAVRPGAPLIPEEPSDLVLVDWRDGRPPLGATVLETRAEHPVGRYLVKVRVFGVFGAYNSCPKLDPHRNIGREHTGATITLTP